MPKELAVVFLHRPGTPHTGHTLENIWRTAHTNANLLPGVARLGRKAVGSFVFHSVHMSSTEVMIQF